jgi:hypothetical protein
MRPLFRYEPVNERGHLAFDANSIKGKLVREAHGAKTHGKYFDQSEISNRKNELNELSELRSYFVSASFNKYCIPHPSLKEISTKVKQKGKSFKEFLLTLFSN